MRNLPLCHWSLSQSLDLRAPSLTDVSILLLNQPIVSYQARISLLVISMQICQKFVNETNCTRGSFFFFSHKDSSQRLMWALMMYRYYITKVRHWKDVLEGHTLFCLILLFFFLQKMFARLTSPVQDRYQIFVLAFLYPRFCPILFGVNSSGTHGSVRQGQGASHCQNGRCVSRVLK